MLKLQALSQELEGEVQGLRVQCLEAEARVRAQGEEIRELQARLAEAQAAVTSSAEGSVTALRGQRGGAGTGERELWGEEGEEGGERSRAGDGAVEAELRLEEAERKLGLCQAALGRCQSDLEACRGRLEVCEREAGEWREGAETARARAERERAAREGAEGREREARALAQSAVSELAAAQRSSRNAADDLARYADRLQVSVTAVSEGGGPTPAAGADAAAAGRRLEQLQAQLSAVTEAAAAAARLHGLRVRELEGQLGSALRELGESEGGRLGAVQEAARLQEAAEQLMKVS